MKRIIICLDGTWNNDDAQSDDTNVSRIARAIHASQGTNGVLQIVLYLRGVGTTGLKIDTLYQGAVGLGVDDNIRAAYQFIAQNYESFSRLWAYLYRTCTEPQICAYSTLQACIRIRCETMHVSAPMRGHRYENRRLSPRISRGGLRDPRARARALQHLKR